MSYKVNNSTVVDQNKNFTVVNSTHEIISLTPSMGTINVDLLTGTYFKLSAGMSDSISGINILNIPSDSTKATLFVLEIPYSTGTPYSIAWPSEFRWADGVAPTLTCLPGKRDVFLFFTSDNGTTWNAFVSSQNL